MAIETRIIVRTNEEQLGRLEAENRFLRVGVASLLKTQERQILERGLEAAGWREKRDFWRMAFWVQTGVVALMMWRWLA